MSAEAEQVSLVLLIIVVIGNSHVLHHWELEQSKGHSSRHGGLGLLRVAGLSAVVSRR